MHTNHLPGASYSTRICVDAGIETWTHLALPDSMSSCGNDAAEGSQTASNARSVRRDGGRVVGDMLREGTLGQESKMLSVEPFRQLEYLFTGSEQDTVRLIFSAIPYKVALACALCRVPCLVDRRLDDVVKRRF